MSDGVGLKWDNDVPKIRPKGGKACPDTCSVHYQGACGTRPSSIAGTLAGIENLVKSIEPDIEVVAI